MAEISKDALKRALTQQLENLDVPNSPQIVNELFHPTPGSIDPITSPGLSKKIDALILSGHGDTHLINQITTEVTAKLSANPTTSQKTLARSSLRDAVSSYSTQYTKSLNSNINNHFHFPKPNQINNHSPFNIRPSVPPNTNNHQAASLLIVTAEKHKTSLEAIYLAQLGMEPNPDNHTKLAQQVKNLQNPKLINGLTKDQLDDVAHRHSKTNPKNQPSRSRLILPAIGGITNIYSARATDIMSYITRLFRENNQQDDLDQTRLNNRSGPFGSTGFRTGGFGFNNPAINFMVRNDGVRSAGSGMGIGVRGGAINMLQSLKSMGNNVLDSAKSLVRLIKTLGPLISALISIIIANIGTLTIFATVGSIAAILIQTHLSNSAIDATFLTSNLRETVAETSGAAQVTKTVAPSNGTKTHDLQIAFTNDQYANLAPPEFNFIVTIANNSPNNEILTITNITDQITLLNEGGLSTIDQPTVGQQLINSAIDPNGQLSFEFNATFQNGPNYQDAVIQNTVTVTLSGESANSSETQSGSAQIVIGTPPIPVACWPVTGKVSQWPHSAETTLRRSGQAIDIGSETPGAITGRPVYSSHAGVARVSLVGQSVNHCGDIKYGTCVYVTSPQGFSTLYAHLNTTEVQDGALIGPGTLVGTVDNTGNSKGNHLHYEIDGGRLIDLLPKPVSLGQIVQESCSTLGSGGI